MIRRIEIVLLVMALAAVVWWLAVTASRAETQHDAPTTMFYDARGNSTGTASRYGNTVKFYAPNGSLLGSSTTTTTKKGTRP